MNSIEYEILPKDIRIDSKMIASLMSLDKENIPEPFNEIIRNEIDVINTLSDIRGGYIISKDIFLNPEEGIFTSEDIQFKVGKDALHFLKNSEMLAFFVCTAGETISKRSKAFMDSDKLLEGYVTDVIGSVLAEEAMEFIHKKLSSEMLNEGLKITNRYSPGNCDWQIDEQNKLFSLLPDNFCSIRLSESALMHPIKSVSGVIGIGKKVRYHKNVCSICKNLKCIYRDKRYRFGE